MIKNLLYGIKTKPIHASIVIIMGTVAAIALASMMLPKSFTYSELHTNYLLSDNADIEAVSVKQWLGASAITRIEPADDNGGRYRVEDSFGNNYVVDVRFVSMADRMSQPPLFKIDRVESSFQVSIHNPEELGITRTKRRLNELVERVIASS
ncbi:hypothetical protein [Pseudoalteromonas sp. GABNS16H]|uniref:hypothetical protein n=1 Tax=Pseudoalteromonas sp. GABNS16H TaxID=3025325 RepID=UPI0023600DA3|nr:hypothetical protein [Pseudoalteromonas sp. GABNS16H]MDC9611557.1 hypothetical protein [Pseudoalteromonas sp. GABNS16H]